MTWFRDSATLRSGEQAALGADVMALMDALGIGRRSSPAITGRARRLYRHGAAAAQRFSGMATVNSYLIQDT